MDCYDVIASGAVSKEIRALLNSIESGLRPLLDKKALISYGNGIDTLRHTDTLRYCVELGLGNTSNKPLTNIFLSHLSSTENKAAGSGIIFMMAFYAYLHKGIRQKNMAGSWDAIETFEFCGTKSTKDDAEKIMANFCDSATANLVMTASELIGSEGSITIEVKSDIPRTSIEVDSLYRFDATPNDVFVQQTGRSSFEIMSPGVVTIDGFIETTAEIDTLMRESFESGQPLIIAARGYQPDVANTLAHNYVNGKLRILPLEIRYDEVGANSLIDISKVCRSEFINSLKGDLISTTSLASSGEVERAIVKSGQLAIQVGWSSTSETRVKIDRQRLNLIKKLSNARSDAESHIINARLRSLTPSHCTLTVKARRGMGGVERDRVGSVIRLFKDVCTFGHVDLTTLEVHDNYFMSSLLQQLIEGGITHVPTTALNMGIHAAAACAETFLRVGACLVIDE